MQLFATDRQLLSTRGSFIIRTLCLLLDAEQVYTALAGTPLAWLCVQVKLCSGATGGVLLTVFSCRLMT
jgi:hypothetical protein